MLHRTGFLREDGFHLRGFHCVIHTVAAAGFHSLIQRDVARNGKHHVAGAVERIGAGVQQFGRQLGNALGGAGDIVPDGMAFIQAAEQCGQQPPIRLSSYILISCPMMPCSLAMVSLVNQG